MIQTPTTNNHSEEIDLGYLINKINLLFKKAIVTCFNIINFYWKRKFIILGLIIAGIAYGIYLDSNKNKTYLNEALVIPNYESVDYLYKKIKEINHKRSIGDSVYLKEIFQDNYKELVDINIEPISDLYSITTRTPANTELFRTLLTNQDIAEFRDDFFNAKYSKYHLINFVTTSNAETLLKNLLNYINSNQHFLEYKEMYILNTNENIADSQAMKNQIDSLLTSYSQINAIPNQGVNISDNSDLFELFRTKISINFNLLTHYRNKVDFIDTIKLVSFFENTSKEKSLQIPNKILYPLLFLLLFSLPFYLRHLYLKMKKIAQSN